MPSKRFLKLNFIGSSNGLAHIGSPETVAKQLEKAHEPIGFDVYCGRHRFGAMPSHLVEKSIRLFGEKVLPALS